MQAKLETDDAKASCGKCKQTVEPVLGNIKSVMGLRHVASEWLLIALACHCRRREQHQRPRDAAPVTGIWQAGTLE